MRNSTEPLGNCQKRFKSNFFFPSVSRLTVEISEISELAFSGNYAQAANDYQFNHASLNSVFKGEQKLAVCWSNKINLEKKHHVPRFFKSIAQIFQVCLSYVFKPSSSELIFFPQLAIILDNLDFKIVLLNTEKTLCIYVGRHFSNRLYGCVCLSFSFPKSSLYLCRVFSCVQMEKRALKRCVKSVSRSRNILGYLQAFRVSSALNLMALDAKS